jgi:hypothetical protein
MARHYTAKKAIEIFQRIPVATDSVSERIVIPSERSGESTSSS